MCFRTSFPEINEKEPVHVFSIIIRSNKNQIDRFGRSFECEINTTQQRLPDLNRFSFLLNLNKPESSKFEPFTA